MGASMSLRSFARFASAVSIQGFGHFGSSLSLRSFSRLGSGLRNHVGSIETQSITLGTKGDFEVIEDGAGTVEFRFLNDDASSNGTKSMRMYDGGGFLHGVWTADSVLSTSDRRLKTNILPLTCALRCPKGTHRGSRFARQVSKCRLAHRRCLRGRFAGLDRSATVGEGSGIAGILRRLRPVAYKAKSRAARHVISSPGKQEPVRFGFLADELERLVPQVVRSFQHQDGLRKGVMYQDLIALLTAALQEQQAHLGAESRGRRKVETALLLDSQQTSIRLGELHRRIDELRLRPEQDASSFKTQARLDEELDRIKDKRIDKLTKRLEQQDLSAEDAELRQLKDKRIDELNKRSERQDEEVSSLKVRTEKEDKRYDELRTLVERQGTLVERQGEELRELKELLRQLLPGTI